MPLHVPNIEEAFAPPKPVYKGKQPLKASDIQCPEALVQHPAFDPDVEQLSFSAKIEKSSREHILDKFPLPPITQVLTPTAKAPPRRPKVAAPPLDLYDDLLPNNPILERQRLLSAARAQIHREEPYRQAIVDSCSSTSRYQGTILPQAWAEPAVFRDGPRGQAGDSQTIMTHSNYSTKSLGTSLRLKEGPGRRVVVNPPPRYDSRPRMLSAASSGSVMDTTSSRRYDHAMEPRKRQASNASTATVQQGAEFGYISRVDYPRTPSKAFRSHQPTSSYPLCS